MRRRATHATALSELSASGVPIGAAAINERPIACELRASTGSQRRRQSCRLHSCIGQLKRSRAAFPGAPIGTHAHTALQLAVAATQEGTRTRQLHREALRERDTLAIALQLSRLRVTWGPPRTGRPSPGHFETLSSPLAPLRLIATMSTVLDEYPNERISTSTGSQSALSSGSQSFCQAREELMLRSRELFRQNQFPLATNLTLVPFA